MIEKIAELLTGHVPAVVVAALILLSYFVEVSKIQINPLSWLGKTIGKAINGGVLAELGGIKTEIGEIKQHNDRQDEDRLRDKALDARRRILQFADEIRRGVRHSLEHFTNVSEDITFYQVYCDEHPKFENDRAKLSIKIIKQTYEKCLKENDFL